MEERGGIDEVLKGTSVNGYALACALIASVISIIFGYDTGVMSGAMIFIKEELKTNDHQLEILAGILNLCALAGSLVAGRTSDYIGRRYTVVLSAVIFLLGAVLMGYAPNFAVLMTGRCTAGIGVGFALMIGPVYSAEISSPSTRGFLTSLPELCISLGILSGYVSNYLLAKLPLQVGWRLMLGLPAIPSLILAVGVLKMPESPRWLAMQGRLADTEKILLRISNTRQEAEARFRDIKIAATETHGGHGVWKKLLLPSPAVRRMLLAAVGILFFEHATGIEAVVLYGPRIFKKAGVTGKDKLLLATVGVGLTKTTFIVVATFLMDKFGRRRLLLVSTAGMIVALASLGSGLTFADRSAEPLRWALAFSIFATYAYVAFFSIGLCPVTWVYSSEIWPLELRAQGMSVGVAVNRLTNAVISMTFISISEVITIGGSFFMFAGVSVVAWLYFYCLLPETKGRSLEDMEMLFTKTTAQSTPRPTDETPRN